MDELQAAALERILEALIASGDGEAFMAVAKRITALTGREVRISVEPPLDKELAFDNVSYPVRFRQENRHGKIDLSLKEDADGRAANRGGPDQGA